MKTYGIVRLTKDIETHDNYTRCSVAENQYNFKTKEQEGHFWNCVLFGKTAERLANSGLGKGDRFFIEQGEFQNNNYENNEGKTVYATQLIIHNFQFVDAKKPNFNDTVHEKLTERTIDITDETLPF